MNNVWIFHHSDGDGYAAAAVIVIKRNLYNIDPYTMKTSIDENVHLVAVNFNNPIDFSKIKENDTVYMLDYTSSRVDDIEGLNDLWNKFQKQINYIHIDHHKTALSVISECNGLEKYLEYQGGIFPTEKFGQAGCMLAYIAEEIGLGIFNKMFESYFHGSLSSFSDEDIKKQFSYHEEHAPEWLQWTADHDIYAEKYPESHIFANGAFYNGLNKSYLALDDNSFLRLSILDSYNITPGIDLDQRMVELYENGNVIKNVMDRHYKKCLNKSFEIYVHLALSKDYIDPTNSMNMNYEKDDILRAEGKILCVDGIGNSGVFLDEFEKYDAVILFSFDGELVKHLIFSKKSSNFPCNAMALWGGKFFGISGGGHDHAAGFYTEELFFKKERIYFLSDRKWKILTQDEVPEEHKDLFKKNAK